MTGQIERIRVFSKVAELKSFAEAARQLNITRSIATRYVSELESNLGVQLLVRTTRKVSMTIAGRIYLDRTRHLLDELSRADELIRQQSKTLQGKLRVSAPFSLGQKLLPVVVGDLLNTYPDLALDVELSDEFIDIVAGGFDMSLRISGPPSDVSTIWRKIAVVPRVIVASPDFIRAHGQPVHPSELDRFTEISYSHFASGNAWQLKSNTNGDELSVTLGHRFQCNNGDLTAEIVARGHGIATLPKFLISDLLDKGQLVEVLTDWSLPEIWLTAYYPPYSEIPAKVEAFTSFIEDLVKTNPALLN